MTDMAITPLTLVPGRANAVAADTRPLPAAAERAEVASQQPQLTIAQQVVVELRRHGLRWAALLLAAFMLIEFAGSAVLNQRAQIASAQVLAERFRTAQGAIGQTGLSPLPDQPVAIGTPIASMAIPALGLEQVVVEGAAGAQLQTGLGHLPGTAGLSERGVSVVAGRRTTWGAPFYRVNTLVPGRDRITVTTVAGPMTYVVEKVGATADEVSRAADGTGATLALATSSPAGVAAGDYFVIAKATKAPYPSTPQNRSPEHGLRSGDLSALASAAIWLMVMLVGLAVAKVWRSRREFPGAVVWALAAPTVAACLVMFARTLDAALPPTL